MPMKPNYRHERNQKARTRELKRQEKQHRREEKSAKRKSSTDDLSANSFGEDAARDGGAQKSESH